MRPLLIVLFACAGFALAQPRSIAVIAHRGAHTAHPENTPAAYRAAIEMRADFVEVDVRVTRDGKLVIMHDSTVDRTTRGHGAVARMTWPELRALGVPTFDEVLRLARGRIGVYVDAKQCPAGDTAGAIDRRGMADHVVVIGDLPFLKEVAARNPRIKVMPEAVSTANLGTVLRELHPRVIAFVVRDFRDDILAVAVRAKTDIFVTLLGSADKPATWQNAIDRGATGIETDRPAELLEYLRAKGLHK